MEGESDRRSGEIHFLNLSKVRTSGVVEMIKAFADVNVEHLTVVCIFVIFLKNKNIKCRKSKKSNVTHSDLDEDLLAILKILAKQCCPNPHAQSHINAQNKQTTHTRTPIGVFVRERSRTCV